MRNPLKSPQRLSLKQTELLCWRQRVKPLCSEGHTATQCYRLWGRRSCTYLTEGWPSLSPGPSLHCVMIVYPLKSELFNLKNVPKFIIIIIKVWNFHFHKSYIHTSECIRICFLMDSLSCAFMYHYIIIYYMGYITYLKIIGIVGRFILKFDSYFNERKLKNAVYCAEFVFFS